MAENGSQLDDGGNGKTISWRVHPIVERPGQGVLLIGIIIICTWAFWKGFGQFFGILSLVVLVLSMAPFFLPTSYRLDEDGIEITSLFFIRHFRPWSGFRNFYTHNVGVHLSTFIKPSRLDAFRGSFIRFAPGNRRQVIAFLNEHIKRTRRPEETDDKA
jgi:hypothetical protein